jgi:hypothetical protein
MSKLISSGQVHRSVTAERTFRYTENNVDGTARCFKLCQIRTVKISSVVSESFRNWSILIGIVLIYLCIYYSRIYFLWSLDNHKHYFTLKFL